MTLTELKSATVRGTEITARNKLGNLHTLIVTRIDARGVELAHNRHSRPIWALTWRGLLSAIERV